MDKIDREKTVIEICKFLKQHNALEKYCVDVVSYHHYDLKVPQGLSLKDRVKYIVTAMVNKVSDNGYPELWDFFESCDTCFSWAQTPEGATFWSTLHNKWFKMVTGEEY